MPRLARLVLPGLPHHVTQRGNRRMVIFNGEADYALYRDLMAGQLSAHGVDCWAWCLMPNHVHFILVPPSAEALSAAVGEAHRRYAAYFNARARTTGHLFQDRFYAAAMDEAHLAAAARYIALNPVAARLVTKAQDWPWSSVRAHLSKRDDALVTVAPLLSRYKPFSAALDPSPEEKAAMARFARGPQTGKPLGDEAFLLRAEKLLRVPLLPRKRGPKPKPKLGPKKKPKSAPKSRKRKG